MANLYPNPPIHPQTTCFGVVFGVLWSTVVLFWYENEGHGADIEDMFDLGFLFHIVFVFYGFHSRKVISLYVLGELI